MKWEQWKHFLAALRIESLVCSSRKISTGTANSDAKYAMRYQP